MQYVIRLFRENTVLFLALGCANMLFSLLLSKALSLSGSKRVAEALGTRSPNLSLYRRCSRLVAQGMAACEKHIERGGIYKKAGLRLKKAGYKGEHSVLLYLAVRYVVSPVVFAAAFSINYPDLLRPLALVVLINTAMEAIISAGKRKINLRFQKYIYKVYKYLHNQISSGIKPTDAVRSAYEIVEDGELKGILVRLAARYELTLDIDTALEEFRSNFDAHEAQTLCVALKQGIETGDNKELLARQEDVMFKKYFNYIQAETDSCRNRSVAAAAVFVAIVVVMIIIPMLNEVGQAVGKIFIN